VVVLPRLAQRFARIRSQLGELGVSATLVQGRDARARGAASVARSFMAEEKERKAGVFALYQTHLAILDYALRSGLQRVLLLEDDAVFHADFPRVFDERVRRAPAEWRGLWLGALLYNSGNEIGRFSERGFADPRELYTSFAVGLQREAIELVLKVMETNHTPIDDLPYRTITETWPDQFGVLWPPVVAAPPFSGSALAHNERISVKSWSLWNGFDARFFDLSRGYYIGGEAGTDLQCRATNASVAEVYERVYASSAADCCNSCRDQWPRCKAWRFSTPSRIFAKDRSYHCFLSLGVGGRQRDAEFENGDFVGCIIEQINLHN
jgi:GR25 family glycosyltransferase involved in LPS biosynthesis